MEKIPTSRYRGRGIGEGIRWRMLVGQETMSKRIKWDVFARNGQSGETVRKKS